MRLRVGAAIIALFAATAMPGRAGEPDPLLLSVQDVKVPFDVFFATVLPGEVLDIEVLDRPTDLDLSFTYPDQGDGVVGERQLAWKAPDEPGHYTIRVRDEASGRESLINTFVMTPASEVKNGRLNGYRIGRYPEKPLRGLDSYKAPLGYIAVDEETKNIPVSPHFTLGQFVCKQQTSARQRYVVLRQPLLLKLEQVVSLLEAEGFDVPTLTVMSGYRTPFYNKAIGNVPNSRHVYGDAADVYLDVAPADGEMDDLSGDGNVTKADANWLYDIIVSNDATASSVVFPGGVGSYNRNAVHGPFVHIDTRGYPARWGR